MLERVLADAAAVADSNVLIGYETADDAGVYKVSDELALVQSVDFFTPVVDEPDLYGEIAAANSLSDIYAMGATPRFALCIVGFPKKGAEDEILRQIIAGGARKMQQAGIPVIGGHSVQNPEITFGYCVTGFVHPARIWSNKGARTGDVLLLTKPIGTGIIATGIKFQKAPAAVVREAVKWMSRLNREAADCLRGLAVHAVTDITGFGLLGHACEVARASEQTLHINVDAVPLIPGVEELARKGMLPGGIQTNRKYVGDDVDWVDTEREKQELLLDPQTSGGLLVAIEAGEAPEAVRRLKEADQEAAVVGRVVDRQPAALRVVRGTD